MPSCHFYIYFFYLNIKPDDRKDGFCRSEQVCGDSHLSFRGKIVNKLLWLCLFLHFDSQERGNGAGGTSAIGIEPLSPLLLLKVCGSSFFCLGIRRTKQEPEEAFWATHQVLLPGGGSQRPTLPPVSRRSGQRQRTVVGLIWKPSMKTSRLCSFFFFFHWCPSFCGCVLPASPSFYFFIL